MRAADRRWLQGMVRELHNYYWRAVRPEVPGHDFREDMPGIESGTWGPALAYFTRGYAFTWSGAPEAWGRKADKIISDRGKSAAPISTFASQCWLEFKQGVEKPNPRLNPLNCDSPRKTATALVASLSVDKYNLVRWAARLLRQGDAQGAFDRLDALQGIGPKIASFFLRDVVAGLGIDEGVIGDVKLIQPIDRWVERGVQALDPRGEVPARGKDRYFRERMLDIAIQLDVPSAQLNTSLFVLGAKFATTEEALKRALSKQAAFATLAKDRLARANGERAELARLVTSI